MWARATHAACLRFSKFRNHAVESPQEHLRSMRLTTRHLFYAVMTSEGRYPVKAAISGEKEPFPRYREVDWIPFFNGMTTLQPAKNQ